MSESNDHIDSLSAKQLSYDNFLSYAITDKDVWSDRDLIDIWQHLLRAHPQSVFSEIRYGIAEIVSPPKTVGEILLGSQSTPVEVEALKDCAQGFGLAKHALPPQIANGLYFIAILVAKQRWRLAISSLCNEDIALGAKWLAGQIWLDPISSAIVKHSHSHLNNLPSQRI